MFEHLCECFDRHKLDWSKLVSITTDGAPALTGKHLGLIRKVQDKVTSLNADKKIIPMHCIIHQESLCKSVLKVKHIVDPIIKAVNYM